MTQRGVILVDVPEPLLFRPPLRVVPAIAEITGKPIARLTYSHAHSDHIAGAHLVLTRVRQNSIWSWEVHECLTRIGCARVEHLENVFQRSGLKNDFSPTP